MFLQFGWRKTKKGPHLICVNYTSFFFFFPTIPPKSFLFFFKVTPWESLIYIIIIIIFIIIWVYSPWEREWERERALLESCPLFALLTKLVWTFGSISWKDTWRQEDWFPLIPPFLQDTFLFTNAVAHIQTHTHIHQRLTGSLNHRWRYLTTMLQYQQAATDLNHTRPALSTLASIASDHSSHLRYVVYFGTNVWYGYLRRLSLSRLQYGVCLSLPLVRERTITETEWTCRVQEYMYQYRYQYQLTCFDLIGLTIMETTSWWHMQLLLPLLQLVEVKGIIIYPWVSLSALFSFCLSPYHLGHCGLLLVLLKTTKWWQHLLTMIVLISSLYVRTVPLLQHHSGEETSSVPFCAMPAVSSWNSTVRQGQ